MKNGIKITVGLCVRNAEATINEAIDSILNQDYPHELMELIVVDGYSKDKTLSIIKKKLLKKTDIRNKFFYENVGLGVARQILVDNASGDYIVWVDGDMALPKDYVRKLLEFMEQNPAAGIAVGKHGTYRGANLVATLENIGDVVDLKHGMMSSSRPIYLGTGGSIYRVKAIRQVGGFDGRIKGAGEDMDAEHRIRAAGWLLYVTQAMFYEKRRTTWKSLWKEYFWYGYGGHLLLHKNRNLITLYKTFLPIAILLEFLRASTAYKLKHQKVFFLLPLEYVFKRIAWSFGFAKSHIDGYGHDLSSNMAITVQKR